MILLAVALFAALSYAVTQSTRSGGGSASKEQAALATSAALQAIVGIQTAVDRLVMTGCAKSQISFEGAQPAGSYPNGLSPANGSCHVFRSGGVAYTPPQAALLDSRYAGATQYGHMIFTRNISLDNNRVLGTGDYALNIYIPYVTDEVCLSVNQKMIGHNSIPTETNNTLTDFSYFAGGAFSPFSSGLYFYCDVNSVTPINQGSCGDRTGCMKLNSVAGFSGVNAIFHTVMVDPP